MKGISRIIMSAALALPFTQPLLAQQSGTIVYEVTAKTDPERMRGFQRGGGDGDEAPQIPDVITFKQTLTFDNGHAKLATERPDFGNGSGGRWGGRARRDSSNAPAQGQAQGQGTGQRRMGMGMMGRGNAQYFDLTNKKILHVFSTFGDAPKTYYTEEDFIIATDAKTADKTKKIAGYTCKKATVKLKDDTYTVWYTTDLPFSFSPINGLLPEANAVVLVAEGGKRAYNASSVNLQAVTDKDLSIPAGAEKISQEQMQSIRQQEMEKLRKRQPQM
ncbi:GLPGLI family protein [Chitinophaga qingshengii]|uniref:GLPGLI family protein n=1 Tax=Chitinophaga qingshengii TaxID=1569794 RepID=A0ABR7TQC6_9BACT|nr:GLPGLI family protein [Chitinophaga qingshengii]MBC9931619.1 GLPGLI family protein [Chitinophaga qingshengii]